MFDLWLSTITVAQLCVEIVFALYHHKFLLTFIYYLRLSYDVAVIQWITSCHKNHMTTRVITFWRVHATSLTMSVSTMCLMFNLKAISVM